MNRRTVLASVGAAIAAPRMLFAQPSKRVFRIGILDDAVESARDHTWRIFRNRLRELVLADGNDVAYEARYARGVSEQLPALAAELVALKLDVIVCAGTPTTTAAMKATPSIPIVFVGLGDPVATGLVASLARPGGNVTGASNRAQEISGKQLELLREVSPGAKRLAHLTDASNRGSVATFHHLQAHARIVNVTITMFDARRRIDLERSFETIKRERLQALVVGTAGVLLEHRDQIVQFAAQRKLPAIYARLEYVRAGGLLAYEADLEAIYLRGADFVQRILRGAKPADMPIEQASSFRMALNLKTARALGIKIPESVRTRVDEVIK